jgi:hypothetical protein
MNVKSRAQLIVWCLPHLGFVEKDEKPAIEPNASINVAQGQSIGTTSLAAGAGPIGGIRRNDFGNDAGV